MNTKILTVDPLKCTGCRDCEIACSLKHACVNNPAKSRIRVLKWKQPDQFLPVSCQHCDEAPCLQACPKEAISREDGPRGVVIDYTRCVGCRACFYACPFGAMQFDGDRGRPFKCNLCDGEPLCVEICADNALGYIDPSVVQYPRARAMARTLKKLSSKGS